MRSRGRVVDRARLESVYRATYRGFESLRLRHLSLNYIDKIRIMANVPKMVPKTNLCMGLSGEP